MLKKTLAVPGSLVQVRARISNGVNLEKGANTTLPHLRVMTDAGTVMSGYHPVESGAILTIVDKPKNRRGINTAVVRTSDGVEGHVYWCELRASCDHVAEASDAHHNSSQTSNLVQENT